jgi:hypothetical protein
VQSRNASDLGARRSYSRHAISRRTAVAGMPNAPPRHDSRDLAALAVDVRRQPVLRADLGEPRGERVLRRGTLLAAGNVLDHRAQQRVALQLTLGEASPLARGATSRARPARRPRGRPDTACGRRRAGSAAGLPWLHQFRGERAAALAAAESLIALASEQGFPNWLAMGTLYRGWALGTPDGVTLMREGIAAFRATGARTGQTHYLAVLAQAYAHLGEASRATSTLEEAIVFARDTGERLQEAELYRLRGELATGERTGVTESEGQLTRAVAIARAPGSTPPRAPRAPGARAGEHRRSRRARGSSSFAPRWATDASAPSGMLRTRSSRRPRGRSAVTESTTWPRRNSPAFESTRGGSVAASSSRPRPSTAS